MKKNFIFLIAILFAAASIQAQVKYFFQADGNLSIIPKTKNDGTFEDRFAPNPTYTSIKNTARFENRFGFNLKGGGQYQLAAKFKLEAFLQFSQINYRQKNNYETGTVSGGQVSYAKGVYYNAGSPLPNYNLGPVPVFGTTIISNPTVTGDPDKQGVAQLGYGGLGASLKYSLFSGTNIGLGATAQVLLLASTYRATHSGEYITSPSGDYYLISTDIKKDKSKDGFTSFGGSCHLSVEQQITKQLAIEGSLTQFINKLYKDLSPELDGKKARLRSVQVGVRYYL